MALDGYTIRCLMIELRKHLLNGRIEKIYQPYGDTLLLYMRTGVGRERLILSANPSSPKLHLTSDGVSDQRHPPMFCMLLRKQLGGGTIFSIEQLGMDRVLEFVIKTTDRLGEKIQKRLICEMMGRHSNIILLEQNGTIIDAIKRVTPQMSTYRQIFPGISYKPPPPQNRLDLSVAKSCELKEALNAQTGAMAARAVTDTLQGVGGTLAKELCVKCGIDAEGALEETSVDKLTDAVLCLADALKNEDFCPAIYYSYGKVFEFSPVPLTYLNMPRKTKTDINTMLDDFFREKTEAETLKRQRDYLLKEVHALIEKNVKKQSNRTLDLQKAMDKSRHGLFGELIIANLYRLKDNAGHVILEDYTRPDSPLIKIELDPNISPLQNANRFFKEYNHAKRTVSNLKKLQSRTEKEIDYLKSVVYSIESCTLLDELLEIKQELRAGKYISPSKSRHKQGTSPVSGPLTYRSGDGFSIYVGRNNRQNDYLTQKFAGKDDMWLHTKGVPGSHVLIKSEGDNDIPDYTLYQAALLAAYHSKARQSGNVPVDYTQVKYVSKPPKSKPGYVVYKNHKTLFVTPNRENMDPILHTLRVNAPVGAKAPQ